jgi:hypothetical protein
MPKFYIFNKETGELITARRGVLRWPSWGWQVAALIISIISGLILSLAPVPSVSLIGIMILAISLYGTIRSRLLTRVGQISLDTRIACIIAVIFGLIVIAVLILSVIVFILISALILGLLSRTSR